LSESLKAQRTQRTLKVEGIVRTRIFRIREEVFGGLYVFVRIAEGAEDTEDAEGRGIFCVFCGFCAFWDSDNPVEHLSPRWGLLYVDQR